MPPPRAQRYPNNCRVTFAAQGHMRPWLGWSVPARGNLGAAGLEDERTRAAAAVPHSSGRVHGTAGRGVRIKGLAGPAGRVKSSADGPTVRYQTSFLRFRTASNATHTRKHEGKLFLIVRVRDTPVTYVSIFYE